MAINHIIFYGLLYRVGLVFVKKQIYEKHIETNEHGTHNKIASEIEIMVSFLEEFFKIFLLIRISLKSGRKSYLNQFHFFILRSILVLIAYFNENPLNHITQRPHYVIGVIGDEFLKTIILRFNVQFISESKGRIAGFLDLMMSILENAVIWITREVVIGECASSLIVVLFYIWLNPKLIDKAIKIFEFEGLKKIQFPIEVVIFLLLGIYKYIFALTDTPLNDDLDTVESLMYGSIVLDELISDVFFTAFVFCFLFFKLNEEPYQNSSEHHISVLTNTITVFWGCSYISLCVVYGFLPDHFFKIVAILLSTSILSTLKIVIEFLFIYYYISLRRAVDDEESYKIYFYLLLKSTFIIGFFLYGQLISSEKKIFFDVLLKNCFSLTTIIYCSICSEDYIFKNIGPPNYKLIVSLVFLGFVTNFQK